MRITSGPEYSLLCCKVNSEPREAPRTVYIHAPLLPRHRVKVGPAPPDPPFPHMVEEQAGVRSLLFQSELAYWRRHGIMQILVIHNVNIEIRGLHTSIY